MLIFKNVTIHVKGKDSGYVLKGFDEVGIGSVFNLMKSNTDKT